MPQPAKTELTDRMRADQETLKKQVLSAAQKADAKRNAALRCGDVVLDRQVFARGKPQGEPARTRKSALQEFLKTVEKAKEAKKSSPPAVRDKPRKESD